MKLKKDMETILGEICASKKTTKIVVIFLFTIILFCAFFLIGGISIMVKIIGRFPENLVELPSLFILAIVFCLLGLCALYYKKVAAFFNDSKNDSIIIAASIVLQTAILAFITIFSYKHGAKLLNSDHASEMILGKILAEEGGIVSKNWEYSTEIRIIYQTLFISPLFKILGAANWALVRAVNILLNHIVLYASYIFFMRQSAIKNKWIFLSALFLFLPLSDNYWDLITFGGYYLFFASQTFVTLGLFLSIINKTNKKSTFPLAVFILFLLVSCALGVQTIRSLLVLSIPLFLMCVFIFILQKRKIILSLGISNLLFIAVGFIFNNILHIWYTFHAYLGMTLENISSDGVKKIGECAVALASFLGFKSGVKLISAEGVLSVLSIVAVILLFLFCANKIKIIYSRQNLNIKNILPIFFIFTTIFNVFVFVITDGDVVLRYFVPFMILFIPLTALFFDDVFSISSKFVTIIGFTSVVFFIVLQSSFLFFDLSKQDLNSKRNGYIRFLFENNLDYGFAEFWEGNVTTELTNGKIEIACLESDGYIEKNIFIIQGWLNHNKVRSPNYHAGKSFILLSEKDFTHLKNNYEFWSEKTPDYEDAYYAVFVFASAREIWEKVLTAR